MASLKSHSKLEKGQNQTSGFLTPELVVFPKDHDVL